jgi:hypothetical protein
VPSRKSGRRGLSTRRAWKVRKAMSSRLAQFRRAARRENQTCFRVTCPDKSWLAPFPAFARFRFLWEPVVAFVSLFLRQGHTMFVTQTDLELRILLPQPPEHWDCRHVLPLLTSLVAFLRPLQGRRRKFLQPLLRPSKAGNQNWILVWHGF